MPHGENLDVVLPKVQEPRDTWFSEPARVCAPATNSTRPPNLIPPANHIFPPSPRKIKQAQKMVDLYNESVAKGAGADGKGGQVVDVATPRIYQPVLDRPLAAGWL